MADLLADADIGGHFLRLLQVLQSENWSDSWNSLGIKIQTFKALNLKPDAKDFEIWETCQKFGLVLVTGNRNMEGPDSLEATIRANRTDTCLPVFTLSDPSRILREREYAELVAVKLMEYLDDLENLRGTGRIYVP